MAEDAPPLAIPEDEDADMREDSPSQTGGGTTTTLSGGSAGLGPSLSSGAAAEAAAAAAHESTRPSGSRGGASDGGGSSGGGRGIRKQRRAEKTSVFRGVTATDRGKAWRARVRFGSVILNAGRFDGEAEAAAAYDCAARLLFGRSAVLNFPDSEDAHTPEAVELMARLLQRSLGTSAPPAVQRAAGGGAAPDPPPRSRLARGRRAFEPEDSPAEAAPAAAEGLPSVLGSSPACTLPGQRHQQQQQDQEQQQLQPMQLDAAAGADIEVLLDSLLRQGHAQGILPGSRGPVLDPTAGGRNAAEEGGGQLHITGSDIDDLLAGLGSLPEQASGGHGWEPGSSGGGSAAAAAGAGAGAAQQRQWPAGASSSAVSSLPTSAAPLVPLLNPQLWDFELALSGRPPLPAASMPMVQQQVTTNELHPPVRRTPPPPGTGAAQSPASRPQQPTGAALAATSQQALVWPPLPGAAALLGAAGPSSSSGGGGGSGAQQASAGGTLNWPVPPAAAAGGAGLEATAAAATGQLVLSRPDLVLFALRAAADGAARGAVEPLQYDESTRLVSAAVALEQLLAERAASQQAPAQRPSGQWPEMPPPGGQQ